MSDFKQDYLNNKTTYKNLHEYVDEWHRSSTTKSLQEFLGLTEDEYHLMLIDDGSLEKKLDNLKLKDNKAASQLKNALAKIIDQKK